MYDDEQCPKRGPGLNHIITLAKRCAHCAEHIEHRTLAQRGLSQAHKAQAAFEMEDTGLIDRLLDLRNTPDPAVLLAGWEAVEAFRMGIDQSLDQLIPALKKISMAETPDSHGANCMNKTDATRLIGRVPMTRTDKAGWL